MIDFLLRLSLLLLIGLLLVKLLHKTDPSWRISICRAFLVAAAVLTVALFFLPNWKWEIWQSPVVSADSQTVPNLNHDGLVPSAMDRSEKVGETQSITTVASGTKPSLLPSWSGVLWAVWAVGVVLFLAQQVYTQVYWQRRIRQFAKGSEAVQKLWRSVCDEIGISATDVRVSDRDHSPFLSVNGTLVVPRSATDCQQDVAKLLPILRHEAAHLRAKDHYWLPLTRGLCSLFWFHPLSWWLNRLHLNSCEDARDAEAARLGGAELYRRTVAGFALQWIPSTSQHAGMMSRKSELLRRMDQVNHNVAKTPASMLARVLTFSLAIALAVVTGVVLLAPKSVLAEPESGSLLGTWTAKDSGKQFAEKLSIVKTDQSMVLKIWHSLGKGKTDPSPYLVDIPTERSDQKVFKASKDFGFCHTYYELQEKHGKLQVRTSTFYTDKSGRKDQVHNWEYVRANPQVDSAGVANKDNPPAKGSGWRGYWRNQDRGSGGTLQLFFSPASKGMVSMEVWGRQGNKLSSRPTADVSLEMSEAEYKKGTVGKEVSGSKVFGFAVVTYKMLLQENGSMRVRVLTDYNDANRADSEHLWLFERGAFE